MNKKAGLWASLLGVIALVAVAGSGFYYWFGDNTQKEFLEALAARGFVYEAMEVESSGTIIIDKASLDIGAAEPATLTNITFTKTDEGYEPELKKLDLITEKLIDLMKIGVSVENFDHKREMMSGVKLDMGGGRSVALNGFVLEKGESGYDLADHQGIKLAALKQILQDLERRGITSKAVSGGEDEKTVRLVEPKWNMGEEPSWELGSIIFQVAETGYDLTAKDWAFDFSFGDIQLKLPLIEIKSLEFSDEIDETASDLPMGQFLSPFLADKAASIRIERPQLSGSYMFDPAEDSRFNVTVGEIFFEKIEAGQVDAFKNDTLTLKTSDIDLKIGNMRLGKLSTPHLIKEGTQLFQDLYSAAEEGRGNWVTSIFLRALKTGPFREFEVGNFRLAGAQDSPLKEVLGEWSLRELALFRKYGFEAAPLPTFFQLTLNDLSLPVAFLPLGRGERSFINCMTNGKDAKLGLFLRGDWKEDSHVLNFTFNFKNNNMMGNIYVDGKLGDFPQSFFHLEPEWQAEIERQTKLKTLKIDYLPHNKSRAFYSCVAQEVGASDVAELREQLAGFVGEVLSSDEEGGMEEFKPSIDKLTTFIRTGGSLLELAMKSKQEAGASLEEIDSVHPFLLFDIDLETLP